MVRNNFIVLFYIPLRVIQLPSDVPKAKEKPSRTHKGTQALSSGHLSVSEGDSQKKRKKFSKELEREEESRDLTQNDTKDHLYGGGSCGWIRTNDTPIQYQRVKNDGTHIGTHELWNELNEVAKKWPKLPKEIRNAILAIVRSVK